MGVPMAIIDEKLIKQLVHALIHSGDAEATCDVSIYTNKVVLSLSAVPSRKFLDKYLKRMRTTEADLTNPVSKESV